MRAVPRLVVMAGLLLAALLLAGVASHYASSRPDGLERVATDQGFAGSAKGNAAGEGPLAEYQAAGVDDPRVSGGVAGVTGVLVVLVLTGGLTFALRRRSTDTADRG